MSRGSRERCRFCADRPAIRRVEVLVGPPPGTVVSMLIDVEPDEEGVVIERGDGLFRRLLPDQAATAIVPLFRIHGRKTCAKQQVGGPA